MNDSMREFKGQDSDGSPINSKLEVAFDWDQDLSDSKQIFLHITDYDAGDSAYLVLSEEESLEMLNHLNVMLGRPLSSVPFAG